MTFDPNAGQESPTVAMSREDIKRLEKKAQRNQERDDRLAQLERERTFLQAGVPLDDKRAGYFIAGYQGENTPEAIRKEWAETFAGQAPAGNGQATTEQERQQAEELARLQAGYDLTAGVAAIPPDKLAERDQKLASLSPTDPKYDQKFNEIFELYGGVRGGMVG